MAAKKRGRPQTVTLPVKGKTDVLKGKVKKFTGSSGAYIPISQKYKGRKVKIKILKR